MDLHDWTRKKAALIVGVSNLYLRYSKCAFSSTNTLFATARALWKTFFQTVDDLQTIWLASLCGLFTLSLQGGA